MREPSSQIPNFSSIVKVHPSQFLFILQLKDEKCETAFFSLSCWHAKKQQHEPCMCVFVCVCVCCLDNTFTLRLSIACLALQLSVCFGCGPAVVSLQAHALEIRTAEELR